MNKELRHVKFRDWAINYLAGVNMYAREEAIVVLANLFEKAREQGWEDRDFLASNGY